MEKRISLVISYLLILFIYTVFHVGIFLNLDRIPAWDTYAYFPSYFFFTCASLFADAEIPWWSPLSQEGIPLYYQTLTSFNPLFPTQTFFLLLAGLNNILGVGFSVYQIYVTQLLFINPALLILLVLLTANRIFEKNLTLFFVTGLTAFSCSNTIRVFNAFFYVTGIIPLLFLYSFLLYFQTRTFGSKMFLSLVIIFLSLNLFSQNLLYLAIYAIPLILVAFGIFYGSFFKFICKQFIQSFSGAALTFFSLAILSGGLASWLIVFFNVNSFIRTDFLPAFDPLMWPYLSSFPNRFQPSREILHQLDWMFFDHGKHVIIYDFIGIATLPFLIIGYFIGKGKLRFIFLFIFLGLLLCLSANSIYALFSNAFRWMENNRHLGEIMWFGGEIFAIFSAGFGLEAILCSVGSPDGRKRGTYKKTIAVLILLTMALYLIYGGTQPKSLTNVYTWLLMAGLLCLTYRDGNGIRRLVTGASAIIVFTTITQQVYYNWMRIQSHPQNIQYDNNTKFIEKEWKLQFKMTGNYISDNSILTNYQGYFFGDERGTQKLRFDHPYSNIMRPRSLLSLEAGLPRSKYIQIIGDHIPRIRFPERIIFANSEDHAFSIFQEEERLDNIAVLLTSEYLGQNEKPVELRFSGNFPIVKVDDFGFNQLEMTVISDMDRYLYYADGYDRFWYAWVNGHPTKIHRANLAHKAIKIPRGKSRIVFKFNPWPIKILYLLTILFTISFFYYSRKKHSRPQATLIHEKREV